MYRWPLSTFQFSWLSISLEKTLATICTSRVWATRHTCTPAAPGRRGKAGTALCCRAPAAGIFQTRQPPPASAAGCCSGGDNRARILSATSDPRPAPPRHARPGPWRPPGSTARHRPETRLHPGRLHDRQQEFCRMYRSWVFTDRLQKKHAGRRLASCLIQACRVRAANTRRQRHILGAEHADAGQLMVGQLPERRKKLVLQMRASRACKDHFKIKLKSGAGKHQLKYFTAAGIGRTGRDHNFQAAFVPAAAGRGDTVATALRRWRHGFAKTDRLTGIGRLVPEGHQAGKLKGRLGRRAEATRPGTAANRQSGAMPFGQLADRKSTRLN